MPIWPVVRRSWPAAEVRPVRRRAARRRRSMRWMIAVALLGLLTAAGCRGDGSQQSSLSPFRPLPWFTKADEPASHDEFSLRPVPRGDTTTAPLPPPAPAPRSYTPPAAPAPEAAGPSASEFYGVRPTAAEEAAASQPSWSDRFRKLFSSENRPTTDAAMTETDAEPLLRPVPNS